MSISAIKATAPLAHTPRIVSNTELKLAKSRCGRAEFSIQLYGVPPIFKMVFTISSAKYASRINKIERIDSFIGSSASMPADRP